MDNDPLFDKSFDSMMNDGLVTQWERLDETIEKHYLGSREPFYCDDCDSEHPAQDPDTTFLHFLEVLVEEPDGSISSGIIRIPPWNSSKERKRTLKILSQVVNMRGKPLALILVITSMSFEVNPDDFPELAEKYKDRPQHELARAVSELITSRYGSVTNSPFGQHMTVAFYMTKEMAENKEAYTKAWSLTVAHDGEVTALTVPFKSALSRGSMGLRVADDIELEDDVDSSAVRMVDDRGGTAPSTALFSENPILQALAAIYTYDPAKDKRIRPLNTLQGTDADGTQITAEEYAFDDDTPNEDTQDELGDWLDGIAASFTDFD